MRAALTLLLLAACAAGDDVDGGDTDLAPTCDGPGAASVVSAGIGNTEGVTIAPDGTAYVVHRQDGLYRLAADGTPTLVAPFGDGIGATWWNGAVWVGTAGDAPALLEIAPDGTTTPHPVANPPAPNFLTPTPWGTLLVADDTVDVVREWRPGADDTTVWAEVPSPNGMGFSPDGGTLWVASTFRSPGLSAVVVEGEAAGAVTQPVVFDAATTPDGLAVASDGSVLVTLNVAGRIAVVQEGVVTDLVPEPAVLTPASLAFGRGGWDPCAVLTTELFGQDVVAIQAGLEGFFPPWEETP